jgi:hypothetical protein
MDNFTRSYLKLFIIKLASAITGENEEGSKKPDHIDSISETALEIVVDSALYHMKRLANEINKFAEHAGRTEVNVLDVFDGLWVFNENCETICDFIIDFPKSDLGVQAGQYPIDSNANETPGIYPYRADALIEFNGLSDNWVPPHVPQFLPLMEDSKFEDLTENDPDFNVEINDIKTDVPLPVINVNIPLVNDIVKNVLNSTNANYVEPE